MPAERQDLRRIGWAVRRPGEASEDVRQRVERVADELRQACASLFPARGGYLTIREPADQSEEGVHLTIRRGDFHARVDLECDAREVPEARELVIRATSSAWSDRMSTILREGELLVRRLRGASLAGAFGVFGVICWVAAGDANVFIGGMFLVIVAACLSAGAWNFGAAVGEGITARRCARALAEAHADARFQLDVRRWNALSRQLKLHRRALARGDEGLPFRRAG